MSFKVSHNPELISSQPGRRSLGMLPAGTPEKIFGFTPAEYDPIVIEANLALGNHRHDHSREGFILIAGQATFHLRTPNGIQTVELAPGDTLMIDKGVSHVVTGKPVSVLMAYPEKVWAESGTVVDPVEISTEDK